MSEALERAQVEALLADVDRASFRFKSRADGFYNCIAWAAGDQERWWWPLAGEFWPDSAPQELTLTAFELAYETVGYRRCNDGSRQRGTQKIVVYVNPAGTPAHAARQLDGGWWASKLGGLADIEHEKPETVSGLYGTPTLFMSRPRQEIDPRPDAPWMGAP